MGNAVNLEQLQCRDCQNDDYIAKKLELEDREVMDSISLKFKLLLSKTIFIVSATSMLSIINYFYF